MEKEYLLNNKKIAKSEFREYLKINNCLKLQDKNDKIVIINKVENKESSKKTKKIELYTLENKENSEIIRNFELNKILKEKNSMKYTDIMNIINFSKTFKVFLFKDENLINEEKIEIKEKLVTKKEKNSLKKEIKNLETNNREYQTLMFGLNKFYSIHQLNSGKELYNKLYDKRTYFKNLNNFFDEITGIGEIDPISLIASITQTLKEEDLIKKSEILSEIFDTKIDLTVLTQNFINFPLINGLMTVRNSEEQLKIWEILNEFKKDFNFIEIENKLEELLKINGLDIENISFILHMVYPNKFMIVNRLMIVNAYKYYNIKLKDKKMNKYCIRNDDKDFFTDNSSIFLEMDKINHNYYDRSISTETFNSLKNLEKLK